MSDISWYSWTLERHIEKGTNPVEVSSPRNAIDSHPTPVGGPPIKARFVVSITYSCNQMVFHLIATVSYRNYKSSFYRWPADWRRMTVDRVPWTRHFDRVCAFFDVPLQSPRIPGDVRHWYAQP